MKNLELLKELVGVQYNDMEGLFAIDNNDSKNIHSLCEAHGIDVKNQFLLGFGFSFGEMRGKDTLQEVYCKVLLLDKEYGRVYEEVVQNLKKESKVKVIKKSFPLSVEELGLYIKRFDSMAIGEISNYINAIEIVEE